jgi:hypothetical protein
MSRTVATACLLLCLCAVAPAHATGIASGSFNSPGERSHNIGIGWPEIHYMWEGLVKDKVALGPRVDVRIWPIVANAGLQMRFRLLEEGKTSLALLVYPNIGFAGFGGARADYPLVRLFASRAFDGSVGGGANIGLLGSFKIAHKWHIMASFENPAMVWIFPSSGGFFVEWPLNFGVGAQFDLNFKTSLWARLGGGPALLFSGPTISIGGHGNLTVGMQFRY